MDNNKNKNVEAETKKKVYCEHFLSPNEILALLEELEKWELLFWKLLVQQLQAQQEQVPQQH